MKPTAFNYADYTALKALCEKQQEANDKLFAENRTLRNELCQRCGRYHEAHLGACDGCRWREKTK